MTPPRGQKQTDDDLRQFLGLLASQQLYCTYFSPTAWFTRNAYPTPEIINRLERALNVQTHEDLRLTFPMPSSEFSTPQWETFYGPDWVGHPFRHAPLFWSKKALEWDVTMMIQKMCSPSDPERGATARAKTFL